VIKIDNKFWFKAHDFAVFLGYQDPDDAVRHLVPSEARKQWGELDPRDIPGVQIPPNWKPHNVLISEGGLYRLLCKSTKPAAIKFEKWVFDDLLPTLREMGTYTVHQHLQFLSQPIIIKDQQLVTKDQLIISLHEKVLKCRTKQL